MPFDAMAISWETPLDSMAFMSAPSSSKVHLNLIVGGVDQDH
jgi:hypothetical protein